MGRFIYHGVEFAKRLTADEQRSFAMLVRNKPWGRKLAKVSIEEQIVPVEMSKPKLTLVSKDEDYEDEDTELTPAQIATIKRLTAAAKAKPKGKVNTFYEEVIVGKREARAEARPYKCPVADCYKFDHRFSKVGWLGNGKAQGHVQIAHKGSTTITAAALRHGK